MTNSLHYLRCYTYTCFFKIWYVVCQPTSQHDSIDEGHNKPRQHNGTWRWHGYIPQPHDIVMSMAIALQHRSQLPVKVVVIDKPWYFNHTLDGPPFRAFTQVEKVPFPTGGDVQSHCKSDDCRTLTNPSCMAEYKTASLRNSTSGGDNVRDIPVALLDAECISDIGNWRAACKFSSF